MNRSLQRLSSTVKGRDLQPHIKQASSSPVVLVGMHCSGTSITAKLMAHLGLDLGRPVWPVTSEHIHIYRINEAVLTALGGSWDAPPPQPLVEREVRLLAGWYREKVIRYHSGLLPSPSTVEPWGWKDPRNSILLPVLMKAFPEMRLVHVRRRKDAAALSLQQRENARPNGSHLCRDLGYSQRLWQDYEHRIELSKASLPMEQVITVEFDDLMTKPVAVLAAISDFAGLDPHPTRVGEALRMIDRRRGNRHAREKAVAGVSQEIGT